MQDAFGRSEREHICLLLLSQGENSSLASQVKGKAREEVVLNYFLGGSLYDQWKIPFYDRIEELSIFLFKENKPI